VESPTCETASTICAMGVATPQRNNFLRGGCMRTRSLAGDASLENVVSFDFALPFTVDKSIQLVIVFVWKHRIRNRQRKRWPLKANSVGDLFRDSLVFSFRHEKETRDSKSIEIAGSRTRGIRNLKKARDHRPSMKGGRFELSFRCEVKPRTCFFRKTREWRGNRAGLRRALSLPR